MAMSKRDIAFAQCGVYLLAWLIRDADKYTPEQAVMWPEAWQARRGLG